MSSRNTSSRKVVRTIDPKTIKIHQWLKPELMAWVQLYKDGEAEPYNYSQCTVTEVNKSTKKVKLSYEKGHQGPAEVYAIDILRRAEEPQILEDLVDINPLNDAELLRCLELRYRNDDSYCYCGPTLISVNPYKKIPKYDDPDIEKMFRAYALSGGKLISYPHIYNLASRAFYQLFDNNMKQAICISGESGAGKSYGTRICMRFLTSIFNDADQEGEIKELSVEDKIMNCNPVMEAFGNAKTVMNNDSSRFGKYFIMHVDKRDKHIKGAEIKNYLLEKSRIVTQAKNERNYHIFYAVLKNLEPEKKVDFRFCAPGEALDMSEYNYLNKSKCYSVPQIDDSKIYNEVCESFSNLGFSPEEQEAVWKTLSLVLNIGNTSMDESTFEEGSQPCKLLRDPALDNVLSILEVDYELLCEGICSKVREFPGMGRMVTPRTPAQCGDIKDALAKDLFNNMFSWIVQKLNLTLIPENVEDYTSIGLLDIFGFEDFTINSIEQFCINYTNEKLQNLYISYVFKAEKVIFDEEGLSKFIGLINYTDNDPIIKLLDKKPTGIFHLIDETCKMAKDDGKDDMRLVQKIKSNCKDNKYYFEFRLKQNIFGIKHTAKEVQYTVNGFVEKNKDELPKRLCEVISGGNPTIYKIFEGRISDDQVLEEKVEDPREKFLGFKFRNEMQSLMDELLSCECNFIRCIKPNSTQKKDYWVPELALKQIRYLGVLDSINVRRESLPIRKHFLNFYERYQDLDEKSHYRHTSFVKLRERNLNWEKLAQSVLDSIRGVSNKEVLIGKTRVFMSVNFQNHLMELLELKQKGKRIAMLKLASSIKSFVFAVRWTRCRKTKMKVCNLAKNLLNTWNSKIEYIKFKKFLSIVKKMQKIHRMTESKRKLRLRKFSSMVIARSYKFYKIRKMLFNAKKIIIAINKCSNKLKFKLFLVRVRINRKIVDEIFEAAFIRIQGKFETYSSETIQRIWRGYFMRIKQNEEVVRLRMIREDHKNNRAAVTIQKNTKGFLVRNRMDRLNRAARFIQGYMRTLYLKVYYKNLMKAVRTIQKYLRMYFIKNKIITKRLNHYFATTKNSMQELRKLEYAVIFKKNEWFYTLENLENYTRVKFFDADVSFINNIPKIDSFIPKLPIIDLNPKMRIFSLLIDFDCQLDTSDFYSQSWGVDFLTFMKHLRSTNTRILHLEVGECFTFAVTDELKIYSWGINDYHQLGKAIVPFKNHYPPSVSKSMFKLAPRVMSCGDDHTIMIDYKNDVYMWGDNQKGQFGLGHPRSVNKIVKLTSLGKNLKTVAAKGNTSYVVTGDGNILKWPNKEYHCRYMPMLVKTNDPWLKFANISCGYGYAIALTINGILFSYGGNDKGQLGHGDLNDRNIFTLIESLREAGEKITEISCGNKHAVCKTANGKVYTWGQGSRGQLGTGEDRDYLEPNFVIPPDQKLKNIKVVSVQAGFNSTYILFENRKLYIAGVSSAKKKDCFCFKRFNLENKIFEKKWTQDLIPMKIYCKWSKSISCCFLIMADFRGVNEAKLVKEKIVNYINTKWEDCYGQMLPPYHKSMAKHISAKFIKKINTVPKKMNKTMTLEMKKENFRNNLQEYERSRTPGRSSTPLKTSSRRKTKTPVRFKRGTKGGREDRSALVSKKSKKKRKKRVQIEVTAPETGKREQMIELKKKLEKLMKVPNSQWTDEDRALINYVRNTKL